MKSCVLFLAAIVLCGCSSITEYATGIDSSYPGTWPTISMESGSCPDLTGQYSDFGLSSYRTDTYDNSLAYRTIESRAQPQTVFLESRVGEIKIELWRDEKLLASKHFRVDTGEVQCRDGALWLPPVVETGGDGTGGYRAKRTLGLRLADNGNLVGEARVTSVGAIVWIIPIAGSQTIWFQWNRL